MTLSEVGDNRFNHNCCEWALSVAMADSRDLSESTTPKKDEAITQGEVQRMMQDLDANFTRKLEALGSKFTEALTEVYNHGHDHDDDDHDDEEPPRKKPKNSNDDVLECENPDLDELESSLLQDKVGKPEETESPETDLLAEIATELSTEEKLGEKVSEKLASIVDGRFQSKLTPELQKSKFEAYNRPENCTNLVVPTVNPEIWNKLPQEAMKADLKLQHIQRAVVKAATATTRAVEALLQAKKTQPGEQITQAVRSCTDSIALCGHASREISLRRRYAIKPHLNKQVTRICDETVPITTKLFGDNLSATLKEVKEADRIGAGSRDDRRPRFTGNRSHDYGYKSRGGFLGRGRHNNRRQWGQQRRGSYRGRQNPSSSLSQ